MVFEGGLKESARSEQAELLTELTNKTNVETKTEIPHVYNQTVFELIGFHLLSDSQKKKVLASAYDRPEGSPVSIGDYFQFFAYTFKVNAISGGRKSRAEFVAAMGAAARVEEAKTSRVLKGMFGGS